MKTQTMLTAILDHVRDAIERAKVDIKPVVLMAPKLPKVKDRSAVGPKLTPAKDKAIKTYCIERDTATGPQERIYPPGMCYSSDRELGIKYWPTLKALTSLQQRIERYIEIENQNERS